MLGRLNNDADARSDCHHADVMGKLVGGLQHLPSHGAAGGCWTCAWRELNFAAIEGVYGWDGASGAFGPGGGRARGGVYWWGFCAGAE